MKKEVLLTVIAWFLLPMMIFGQTYSSLWKKVEEAGKKDLPKSQYEVLQQIVEKATKEKVYGQLLKAELQAAQVMQGIAPDSLKPTVQRIQQRCDATQDMVLKTVYQTVLWRVWEDNPRLSEEDEEGEVIKAPVKPVLTQELCETLARVNDEDFKPFLVSGVDSRIFNHDLLSVIGQELKDYQPLHDYYAKAGHREAACLTGLWLLDSQRTSFDDKAYLQALDSLMEVYQDLPEAGEIAIARYQMMERDQEVTAAVKMAYSHEALNRWDKWPRMNSLRNAEARLTNSQFHVNCERRAVIPHQPQEVILRELRNLSSLKLSVYPVKTDGKIQLNPNNDRDYKKIKPLLQPVVQTTERLFPAHEPYDLFQDTLAIEGLPVGVYMLEFSTQPATEVLRYLYFVSDVYVVSQPLPDNQIRYVVVRATTGQPIPKARLDIRERISYNEEKTYKVTTDGKGEYVFKCADKHRYCYANAYTDTDQACPELSFNGLYNYHEGTRTSRERVLYTDRAIYRPGQTVHASALVYDVVNGFEHQTVANTMERLVLRDANYKVIQEQEVTTDRYGVCAADFTLPSAGLTGSFCLQMGNSRHYFRVEEYKRPTFEVTFPDYKEDYAAGDTVTLQATARSYAGVPVQGAKVSYRVVRRLAYWWWTYHRYWQGGFIGTGSEDVEITTGETLTEGDGTFAVSMPLTIPKTDYPMFYQFVLTADVTDSAGETHSGQFALPLGNRKTALSVDLEEQILLESEAAMTFHWRNAAGQDLKAQVKYRFDKGKWLTAQADTPLPIGRFKLKSGQHQLEAVCESDTITRDFTLFSLDDQVPATKTDDWFYVSADRFPNDGTPVTLQAGSSARDVYIVYSIFSGNKVVEQGATNKSNALINRKLTYKEEWGDGILCTFAWVKNGICYAHQQTIARPLPDKKLKLQWKTFRDRLTPGQQEEWTLSVTKDGQPVEAMLMATLYDKSLDQLAPHRWSLYPRTYRSLPVSSWFSISPMGLYDYRSAPMKTLGVADLDFSTFDHEVYPSPWRFARVMSAGSLGSNRLMRAKASMDMMVMEAAPMAARNVGAGLSTGDEEVVEAKMASDDLAETEPAAQVQIRENLQETAFFYPQLTTDEQGGVALKFTLPESLTTWRFMGLAHTRDLCYGMIEGEAIARKDVMIQPNMPRFIREGDESTVSARIFNTSEKPVQGKALLRLKDPSTDEVVYETAQSFSVDPDATTAVLFNLQIINFKLQTSNFKLLICQVLANGESFSDGEQHYLPILPATERVTVTRPFTQIEPGIMTIDLRSLFPSADKAPVKDSKLTIEYTNNPAWLMIQALPAIGQPVDDNAISQTASFYANSIGKFIVDQNPKIQTVFKLWQNERLRVGELCSLMSALEKNQELKDLVLNETPWVLDADRESEQKQRLADFFDENTMQMRLSSALTKMKALQRSDGSWSWWPDMPGSFYMTVEISEMLVRQNALIGTSPDTKDMLSKAFRFMGREIVDLVDEMKQSEKKGHKPSFPSFKALQWLYLCALDGRTLPANVQKANDYLIPLLRKDIKSQSIYEKAMTAVIWSKLPNLQPKDRQKAQEYVRSLKEFTVYREDMGRYYDTPRAGYSWFDYKIPTQTMAVEALQMITPDDKQTIMEMQRWLLQEKRTQSWDTPINSVNAVYAFLNGNSPLSTVHSPLSTIKVDAQPLEIPQATAGLGYIKQVIDADSKTLTIEKSSEGTSWGAVYAQFTQQTSEIENSSSGLKIIREILPVDNSQITNFKLQTSNFPSVPA